MTNIGNWLQQKREADGMTLKAQSELVGIKNTVLCELSSGKRPVTEKTLDRIIEGYKMTDEEKRNFYSALITENEKKRAKQAAALLSEATCKKITPAEHVTWIKYGV